jgi:hypothetical protein
MNQSIQGSIRHLTYTLNQPKPPLRRGLNGTKAYDVPASRSAPSDLWYASRHIALIEEQSLRFDCSVPLRIDFLLAYVLIEFHFMRSGVKSGTQKKQMHTIPSCNSSTFEASHFN